MEKSFAFLVADIRSAPLWFLLRVLVGWEWLHSGWEKIHDSAWVGSEAGVTVTGFLQWALTNTSGECPDVLAWYAWFIQHVALPNAVFLSYVIAWGELLLGIAFILGLFVGFTALCSALLSMSFMLAGASYVNPLMYTAALVLLLGYRVAGYWGIDRYIPAMWRRFSIFLRSR